MKTIQMVPYALGLIFLIMTAILVLAFNFMPDFFEWIPIHSIKRYHVEAVPHHIASELGRINFHALFGIIMVALNMAQLSNSLRKKSVRLHRAIGIVYLAFGTVAVITAVMLTDNMYAPMYVEYAVYTLVGLWFFTAFKGLVYIYKGNYRLHRRWMLRNFFITISTMFVRPIVVLEFLFSPQKDIEVAFSNGFWLSVVISILLSQWFIEKSNA